MTIELIVRFADGKVAARWIGAADAIQHFAVMPEGLREENVLYYGWRVEPQLRFLPNLLERQDSDWQ